MRNLAITAAVAVMLTATVASAQGPPDRERRGGGERAAPQQRAAPERAQRPQTQMREQRAPRVERPSRQEPSAAQVNRSEERRARRSVERERPAVRERQRGERIERRAEQRREQTESSRERRQDKAERRVEPRRERVERREKRIDRPAEQRREQVERRAVQSRDRVERREGGAERGREDRAGRREAARTARAQLPQEQRVRLRDGFDRQRARVTNVRFTARIGTHIPRRVRLYAIPAAVLAIVPAYSAYRYVHYEDDICIVDPVTYEIVDVIEYGPSGPSPGGPQIAALELTAAERELILDSIGPDFPEADVRIRLALGAEVPRAAELHAFPEIVIDRIPKVRSHRFIVVDRDVVIVDPRQREIALVLRR